MNRTSFLRFFLFLGLASSSTGCVDASARDALGDALGDSLRCIYVQSSGPRLEGELERSSLGIAGLCQGPCSLERPVATGARLSVRVDRDVPPTATLVSLHPSILDVVESRYAADAECSNTRLAAVLEAHAAGPATLELRDGDVVLDRFTLSVADVASVEVASYPTQLDPFPESDRDAPVTAFKQPCGVAVRVVSREAEGNALLDDRLVTWTITRPDGTVETFDEPMGWVTPTIVGPGTYQVATTVDGTPRSLSFQVSR